MSYEDFRRGYLSGLAVAVAIAILAMYIFSGCAAPKRMPLDARQWITFADFNSDGSVDLYDYAIFQLCFTGDAYTRADWDELY